ncbi:single-stranded DNA-binding protein, partial [Clostridioides difficile]
MNSVILIGRLTKDPELKYIPGSGTAVSTFTIAVDRDYIKKDGTKETDFIPIEVMGKLAEICANNLTKGRLIGVEGSIRVNSYEKEGEKRTYTKVHANK